MKKFKVIMLIVVLVLIAIIATVVILRLTQNQSRYAYKIDTGEDLSHYAGDPTNECNVELYKGMRESIESTMKALNIPTDYKYKVFMSSPYSVYVRIEDTYGTLEVSLDDYTVYPSLDQRMFILYKGYEVSDSELYTLMDKVPDASMVQVIGRTSVNIKVKDIATNKEYVVNVEEVADNGEG